MGFFSKVWKGIKSGVKSIGKGIKSAVSKVGKFMDKIGIVGQIALMFVLPGIGGALGGMLSNGVSALQGMGGLAGGIGNVLSTAGKFASTAGNAFKTVTEGISSFVGEIGKGFVNQVGKAFGKEGLVIGSGQATVQEGFGKWMQGVAENASNIASPFSKTSEAVTNSIASKFEESFSGEAFGNIQAPQAGFSGGGFSSTVELPKVAGFEGDSPFKLSINNADVTNKIIDSERGAMKNFLSSVTDFATKNLEEVPGKIIDNTGREIASGVADSALGAIGLGPETPEFTQVTNVIPEFNHAPVTDMWNKNGISYGATPDNRLQFYAANNGIGNFGAQGFNQFSTLRG